MFWKKSVDPVKAARRKRRRRIHMVVDIVMLAGLLLFIYVPVGWAQLKVQNFERYARDVTELQVPDAAITALGEAAHGNVEFQELKLTVLQQLVTQGYHGFALEADYGDCAVINDWIQGGEGTLDEMTDALSFRIYRTEQMRELLGWMREYNASAADREKLRFYGFDLQGMTRSAQHILSYCREHDITEIEAYADTLEQMEMPKEYYSDDEADHILAMIDPVRELLETHSDESDSEYRRALHEAELLHDAVLMNKDAGEYASVRDRYMAQNVEWIVAEEERQGNSHIMLSAHNGHVAKQDSYRKVMGEYLAEVYGDSYFVIGTDFYETDCNLPSITQERIVRHFVSADPLAAQLKRTDGNMAYLDFASVPETENGLYRKIHSKMNLGSLGEAYSPIMKIAVNSYRTRYVPNDLYDAMIFVYRATPVEVLQ